MADRSFEEVSVLATGTQLFQHRFPQSRPLDDDLPRIAPWRCNLTALSHTLNLYFVAYAGKIYVYEPQFPTQQLSQSPALIIDTGPSAPGLDGHISRRQPHAINNLITQFLGEEEALAAVRDNGDVDAYRIRHIYQAIEKRTDPHNTLGLDAADIRPFFQRNVGKSAWGLAIHSEARMIAVSSNNLEVTIFTFALVKDEVDYQDEDVTQDEEHIYRSASGDLPPSDRKNDDTRIISNGRANIPHIAFCNTGHDPNGEWLLSTDISGVVRSWNVHTLLPGESVRANARPHFLLYSDSFDVLNSGWTVMFLDPQSFCPTSSVQQALGMSEDQTMDHRSPMWDLSKSITRVAGSAPTLVHSQPLEVLDGNYANPAGTSTVQVRSQYTLPADERSPPAEYFSDEDNDERDVSDFESDDEHDMDQSQTLDSVEAATEQIGAEAAQLMAMTGSPRASEDGSVEEEDQPIIGMEQDEIDDEEAYDSDISYEERSRPDTRSAFKMPQILFQGNNSLCGSLPCPILHASVNSTYLFQPSLRNRAHDHIPLIVLSDCFKQDTLARHQALNNFERCNMSAQIPSLGVVVLATQKGRVAIMTLTQLETEAPDAVADSGMALRRVFAFRVDHILPFASQEAAGHRPIAPLHGIAVGPVQGTEGLSEELKRWRLLVMYQDQSVLSYEIGRARGDGLDVSGMMI